jgi:hypothetical protein
MTAAIAIYVIKRWLVQNFHHTNIGRIILLPLEYVTLALCLLYQELLPLPLETKGRHIQPIRNKEKAKELILIGQRILKTGK